MQPRHSCATAASDSVSPVAGLRPCTRAREGPEGRWSFPRAPFSAPAERAMGLVSERRPQAPLPPSTAACRLPIATYRTWRVWPWREYRIALAPTYRWSRMPAGRREIGKGNRQSERWSDDVCSTISRSVIPAGFRPGSIRMRAATALFVAAAREWIPATREAVNLPDGQCEKSGASLVSMQRRRARKGAATENIDGLEDCGNDVAGKIAGPTVAGVVTSLNRSMSSTGSSYGTRRGWH